MFHYLNVLNLEALRHFVTNLKNITNTDVLLLSRDPECVTPGPN